MSWVDFFNQRRITKPWYGARYTLRRIIKGILSIMLVAVTSYCAIAIIKGEVSDTEVALAVFTAFVALTQSALSWWKDEQKDEQSGEE